MHDPDTPVITRSFGSVDAKRTFYLFAILAAVGVVYWFILPCIQSQIVPDAPGGAVGPWVVRPIEAFHFGAVAVLTSLTAPFLVRPLQWMWIREDAVLGTQFAPFHQKPLERAVLITKGWLLGLIYACSLIFYLFSWTIVGLDGIEERFPWAKRKHFFKDIKSLETIPGGQRSDSLRQNGPWYSITLQSSASIKFSLENEGMTLDDLIAMTSHIANRSGLLWQRRADARER